MDNYGIIMKGPFLCESVATLPTWTSADERRFIYTEDTDKTYFGTGTAWAEFGSGGGSTEVQVKNSGYTITLDDAFITFTCDSSSDQIFLLPSVGSDDIGIEYSFTKLGTGKVTITAADTDIIEDSGAGLSIYCDDVGIASITLKLVTQTQWIIKSGATGTWTTTV